MKESKLPKRFWLIIAVAMILVSMIGSNLVQSDGGKVKIHKVNLVVADGAEPVSYTHLVRCHGTMRKRRGCRRSMNGMSPSTMPLWGQ